MTTSKLLRFSLRDLLCCSVVFGLALGWWLDHRRITSQLNRADNVVQALHFGQQQYRKDLDKLAPVWRQSPQYVELPTLEETREFYGR